MASVVRLRLVADNGENVMLTSSSNRPLSLESLLQMLRQLNPGGADVRAVEYEDDEGDLVTVTNDEEVNIGFGSFVCIGICNFNLLLTSKLQRIRNCRSFQVQEMISFASLLAADEDGGEEPLLVFPKAVSGINNIYNLTLALSGGGGVSGEPNASSSSPYDSHNKSQRQPSADLGEILSKGQISFAQLEYSRLLGKGNSGTGI